MARREARKRGPGRPAKITLEVVEQIGTWMARGMTDEQACCQVDVNWESFRTARKRNKAFEPVIKKAKSKRIGAYLTKIEAGLPGWQGSAWILERCHKPQFNRTDTHALTDPQGTAVDLLEMERITKQELKVRK